MEITTVCRCCGGVVIASDHHPIHTQCIPKHWGKHAHGVSASRCKEFGNKKTEVK